MYRLMDAYFSSNIQRKNVRDYKIIVVLTWKRLFRWPQSDKT